MGILRNGLGHPAINVDENDDETDHRQSPDKHHQSSVILSFTGENEKFVERLFPVK
jgi:hypothetical protein